MSTVPEEAIISDGSAAMADLKLESDSERKRTIFVAGEPNKVISSKDSSNSKNDAKRESLKGWLTTIMPLAEFLLLLAAIIIFIEVAPEDIPSKCSTIVQQQCMNLYLERGGEYEASLIDLSCGYSRVACWRSGVKDMLYFNQNELPPGTTSINISDIGLPPLVLANYGPHIEYCQCMLSDGFSVPLPVSVDVWRQDTHYFCDVLQSINAGIGISGVVLASAIVAIKSIIESDGYKLRSALPLCILVIGFWAAWSFSVVVIVEDYSSVETKTDCERPAANIFYYIWLVGVMSLLGALYAITVIIVVSIRMACLCGN